MWRMMGYSHAHAAVNLPGLAGYVQGSFLRALLTQSGDFFFADGGRFGLVIDGKQEQLHRR